MRFRINLLFESLRTNTAGIASRALERATYSYHIVHKYASLENPMNKYIINLDNHASLDDIRCTFMYLLLVSVLQAYMNIVDFEF